MRRMTSIVSLIGVVAALASGPASAALITDGGLTLNTTPSVFYQQTKDDPCIIGNNDCKNPSTFDFTDANPGGNGTESDKYSPLYSRAQVLGTLDGKTTFIVGLDYNDNSNPQILRYFEACYYTNAAGTTGKTCQIFDPATEPSLKTLYNGTGFSDFLLSGFVIPTNALSIKFRATWYNNDGPDSYFLIGGDNPPTIPEPGTIALLGLGLGALGLIRRRRR